MGRETIYFSERGGEITGHISFTTPDAVFKHDGKKIIMSFHPYLGPSFEVVDGKKLVDIYPDEEPAYDKLWEQFYGWFRAKGESIYK